MTDSSHACRHCRGRAGRVVLDLGSQPPCGRFPDGPDPADDRAHPLAMWRCDTCDLAQLVDDPGDSETGLGGVEPAAMVRQTEDTLDALAAAGVLGAGRRVVEYGSPHGLSWGDRLRARGLVPVPPRTGPADVVLDVYGLLHEPDQHRALAERAAALGPDGTLVLQLHSLAAAVARRNWAELRHAHFAYWSLAALDDALRRHGLGIHRARTFPMDGGTAVVTVTRRPAPDDATRALLAAEAAATTVERVAALQGAADREAHALRGWLERHRRDGAVVVGYGAASRAVPVLCHAGIDRALLRAVGDASATKQGRRMPGTDVPVVTPAQLVAMAPDVVLVMLPDLLPEMRAALPAVEAAGGRWVDVAQALDPRVDA